jgi:two-component system chemotaxis response regulator CheY
MSTKILTVDDSKMVRLMVAKTFQPCGCEVYEASNGIDGLATAESIQPHLIFLDITMADMNGLEVLEKLRQIPNLAATPVVMLTAESGLNSIEKADKLKVVGYVSKPFKSEKLLEIASKFIKFEPVATP